MMEFIETYWLLWIICGASTYFIASMIEGFEGLLTELLNIAIYMLMWPAIILYLTAYIVRGIIRG